MVKGCFSHAKTLPCRMRASTGAGSLEPRLGSCEAGQMLRRSVIDVDNEGRDRLSPPNESRDHIVRPSNTATAPAKQMPYRFANRFGAAPADCFEMDTS